MRRLMIGLAIAATAALLPSTSQADDQQIADFIKSRLQVEQQQGNLKGFNVDMRVDRGTVWFKGFVSTPEQENLILRTAQKAGYLGVVQVVDDIDVSPALAKQKPQKPQRAEVAASPAPPAAPASSAPTVVAAASPTTFEPPKTSAPAAKEAKAVVRNPLASQQEETDQQYKAASYQEPEIITRPTPEPIPTAQVAIARESVYSSGAPLPFAQAGGQHGHVPATQVSAPIHDEYLGAINNGYGGGGQPIAGGLGTPVSGPINGGGGISGSANLPGYAWPGYAASPNYAALTYPKQYSPAAWPYIGPFYPYPQVPLGWRKVQLEWDDGWWFLDFKDR